MQVFASTKSLDLGFMYLLNRDRGTQLSPLKHCSQLWLQLQQKGRDGEKSVNPLSTASQKCPSDSQSFLPPSPAQVKEGSKQFLLSHGSRLFGLSPLGSFTPASVGLAWVPRLNPQAPTRSLQELCAPPGRSSVARCESQLSPAPRPVRAYTAQLHTVVLAKRISQGRKWKPLVKSVL